MRQTTKQLIAARDQAPVTLDDLLRPDYPIGWLISRVNARTTLDAVAVRLTAYPNGSSDTSADPDEQDDDNMEVAASYKGNLSLRVMEEVGYAVFTRDSTGNLALRRDLSYASGEHEDRVSLDSALIVRHAEGKTIGVTPELRYAFHSALYAEGDRPNYGMVDSRWGTLDVLAFDADTRPGEKLTRRIVTNIVSQLEAAVPYFKKDAGDVKVMRFGTGNGMHVWTDCLVQREHRLALYGAMVVHAAGSIDQEWLGLGMLRGYQTLRVSGAFTQDVWVVPGDEASATRAYAAADARARLDYGLCVV